MAGRPEIPCAPALEIVVRSLVLGGELLGAAQELLGHLLDTRNEILPGHEWIDESVKSGIIAERQVPFENHSIGTSQSCYNDADELLDKTIDFFHGVLLLRVCNPHQNV